MRAKQSHEYWIAKHKPGETVYTCQTCGRRILVHGRTCHRKQCDECLSTTRYGRNLLRNRFPYDEEVLEG